MQYRPMSGDTAGTLILLAILAALALTDLFAALH